MYNIHHNVVVRWQALLLLLLLLLLFHCAAHSDGGEVTSAGVVMTTWDERTRETRVGHESVGGDARACDGCFCCYHLHHLAGAWPPVRLVAVNMVCQCQLQVLCMHQTWCSHHHESHFPFLHACRLHPHRGLMSKLKLYLLSQADGAPKV